MMLEIFEDDVEMRSIASFDRCITSPVSAAVFETACARATRYLETAHPSAANLIWIDAEPDAAFPEPGPNVDYLTDLLKRAEPRPEAGALAAAFDLALRQLAQARGHRELVILSDFQATAWRNFAPSLPPNVTVRAERVATSSPPNLAVTDIVCQPADPVVGQHGRRRVRLRRERQRGPGRQSRQLLRRPESH